MRQLMSMYACILALLVVPTCALADGELTQVHQDFSTDPGWEGVKNRVEASDPPTIKQDFGWAATNRLGGEAGEIGGTIWQSKTPAYYAIPLNRPLSFKDPFSFSCRIAFMPTGGGGAAYLGFFNHELQGWRVWNSMAVRLAGETGGQAAFGADAMNGLWKAVGGTEGYIHVPVDGKPHMLRFEYQPELVPAEWTDTRLHSYLSTSRQSTEQILEKARKEEPDLTKEQLEQRLEAAHAEGLVYYLQRTGHESVIGFTSWSGRFWGLREGKKEPLQGGMIIQVDDGKPFKFFISKTGRDGPVLMDRFGLFNLQLYHQYVELYMNDLTVNGHKVDLSKDPGWESQGNRVQFVEQDFQRQNYGFSETNWAGNTIGEVGGQFSSAENQDPITGYYGDDIGMLTLDDPLSFSGNLSFVDDSTDAGMQIGFFNSKDMQHTVPPKRLPKTSANTLGILIEGSARGGKQFGAQFTSGNDLFSVKEGIAFRPTRESRQFKVEYDPKANNNLGRITVTLDKETVSLDLTAEQRAAGATFDRFGIANLRNGGKFVTVYYDDLTYTVRRPADYKPVMHKQEITRVSYPPTGRKY